jgi:hypothetical protein
VKTVHKVTGRRLTREYGFVRELADAKRSFANYREIIELARSREEMTERVGRSAVVGGIIRARRERVRLAQLHVDRIEDFNNNYVFLERLKK